MYMPSTLRRGYELDMSEVHSFEPASGLTVSSVDLDEVNSPQIWLPYH